MLHFFWLFSFQGFIGATSVATFSERNHKTSTPLKNVRCMMIIKMVQPFPTALSGMDGYSCCFSMKLLAACCLHLSSHYFGFCQPVHNILLQLFWRKGLANGSSCFSCCDTSSALCYSHIWITGRNSLDSTVVVYPCQCVYFLFALVQLLGYFSST